MSIKIGNTGFKNIYVGDKQISRAYIGEDMVFNKNQPPTPPALPTITWTSTGRLTELSIEGCHTMIDNNGNMFSIIDRTCSTINGLVYISSNFGSSWSPIINSGNNTCAGGVIGNNRFIVRRCGQSSYNISKSINYGSWTNQLINSTYHYEAFNKVNGWSFITSYLSRISRTSDGNNFTWNLISPQANISSRCTAYYNNNYYFTRNGVGTYYSHMVNGTSLTAFSTVHNQSIFVDSPDKIIAYVKDQNTYKYCTGNGLTFASTGTVPNSGQIQCIDYIDGIYWAFYNSSTAGKRVAISSNGINWTEQTVPTTFDNNIWINGNLRNSWYHDTVNNKKYIIVSNRSGRVLIGSYDA